MSTAGTTLALSPSMLAGRQSPRTLKRKRPGDPIYFSPSLASYTQHLFHARRPSLAAGVDSSSPTTMPRPQPPPTPGSSNDIRGKEGLQAAGLAAFNLPPTAFPEERDRNSSTPSNNGSDSSYRPVSPGMSGKRPAGAVIGKEDFELPPPPTRSRKIIQMKPQSELPVEGGATEASTQQSGKSQTGGKRKQGAGTTAAGRKIARKTAHSLIERRRRSKMNEEFGVLKDMIPACKGQEMHKLAILQASIDYLRYLEQCVSGLKQNNQTPSSQRLSLEAPLRRPQQQQASMEEDDDEEDEEEDEEMEDEPPAQPQPQSAISTPAFNPQDKRDSQISLPSLSTITTTSPSIFSHTGGRHYSISSASQASYSPYFHSAHTSPAFGPQLSHHASGGNGIHGFRIGSPALKPQEQRQIADGAAAAELSLARQPAMGVSGNGGRERRSEHELDQEAAGGLLMLNNDRRSWQQREREKAAGGATPGKASGLAGMSVKDLLTS